MPIETDVQEFLQAARPLETQVWISRPTHVACRQFLVACKIIAPGSDADRHQYGVALLELLRTNQLPVAPPPPGPTPEELQAQADRRNCGVMFKDDDESAPVRKVDDSVFSDPRLLHNTKVDAEMQRRNDLAVRGHAFANKLDGLGEAIPGLRDERAEVRTDSGHVAQYATQQLREKNRAHNAQVRKDWQAKKATAERSKQRGL
jgi:hypothetical protein